MSNTKCGQEPLKINLYTPSQDDVTRYLQNNVLGIKIVTDFERWEGVGGNAYIRMRLAINAKDIATDTTTGGEDIVSRLLREDGSPYLFKKEVLDALEPFMFPKNLPNILSMPDVLEELSKKGIHGQNLEKLLRYYKPQFSKDPATGDWFCIYLRPERILEDMYKDPTTNKTSGEFQIINVKGGYVHGDGYKDPVSWKCVVVDRKSVIASGAYDVSIDSIFSNIV